MGEKKEATNSAARVVVRKVVRADRERVFDAWTRPELMQHWYVGAKGQAKVTVDLRVGGNYSNEMLLENCANDQSVGEGIRSYLHSGTYLEISRPERLVFTWNSPSVQNTTVTVELREVELGTEVTITHELATVADCESHRGGWTFALDGLGSFLS